MAKYPVDKNAVIDVLEKIAVLLELREANIFKIRAFSNAARVLEGCSQDLETLIKTGELETLKGIGKGHIAKIIHELYEKGRSKDFEDLKKGFPDSLFDLLRIQGLGAKRVKILYDKLKIQTVEALRKACEENHLAKLEGFGPKSQENILKGIQNLHRYAGDFLLITAKEEAERFAAYLKQIKGVQRLEIAGSIRRHKEIVHDIDILAAGSNSKAIHQAFLKYPSVRTVLAQGDTKSSVLLRSGIQCDLRTVQAKEFACALYYFTGSKEHNVAVRTLAKKKKIKVNEYNLMRGKKALYPASEKELFEILGLHYVPPEARENGGEIEWVLKKEFPTLVEMRDIRGVFHVHSTYSDGTAPLEKMIQKAQDMGFEYVGVSDHSQSAAYAGGLKLEDLKRQWKEIESLQKKFKIRIFKGIESDILADGNLDYPEAVLAQFDFVIGSVHSRFNMPEKEMTERLRRAIHNKYFTFLGHSTGRLLLKRPGYKYDFEKIFDALIETGRVMEINADPKRLDLDWRYCRTAKEKGLRFSIHPDAHSVEGMEYTALGVGMARKGWLEKKDVVNTLSVEQMEKFLKARR